jgi:ERCC4-related helicase
MIARMDCREEEDVDVKKYIKEKIIEVQTVKISGDLVSCGMITQQALFLSAVNFV